MLWRERTTRPLHDVTCGIRASCTTVRHTFHLHDARQETRYGRVARFVGADKLLPEKGNDGVLGDLSADVEDGGVRSLSNHYRQGFLPFLPRASSFFTMDATSFSPVPRLGESRCHGHAVEEHVLVQQYLHLDHLERRDLNDEGRAEIYAVRTALNN